MSSKHAPIGVILAGGGSRRMGVDKAMLDVDGRPMIVAVADALWEAGCHPVVCQGGDAALTTQLGFDVAPDADPGGGPVLAIRSALQHHGRPIVVAACDLVDLDAASVRAVIDGALSGSEPLVSVATSGGRAHLLSYWSPKALAPLNELVAEGVVSYRTALERLDAFEVGVELAAVRNINRPEDLA